MAIEGRVREAVRRELHRARPLVIDGAHDLDGCWALDRSFDDASPTAVWRVLDEVRTMPHQRATVAVAARMAEHLQRYRWPSDLVVVPVPSGDPVVDLLAQAVAFHLEVPWARLLRRRWSPFTPEAERRISARARTVPAHVLLVDDRVATGRTLRDCGWALRDRGASAVWAMVAAADVRTEVSEVLDDDRSAGVRERRGLADVWTDLSDEPVDETDPVDEPVDETDLVDETELAEPEPTHETVVEIEEPVDEVEPVDEIVEPHEPELVVEVESVEVESVEVESVEVESVEVESVEVESVEPVTDETVTDETVADEPAREMVADETVTPRAHPRRPKRRNRRAHKR